MEILIVLLITIIVGFFGFLLSELDLKIPLPGAIIAEHAKFLQSISEREKEIEKKKCCAICKYYYTQPVQQGYYDEEFCRRFPEKISTRDKHWCGEFKLNEKLYYEKVAEDYCTNPFRSEK